MPETQTPTLKAGRPAALLANRTHYCAGCGHGVVHRLLAEIIDEWDLRGQVIGMAPVGCAVLLHQYLDIDACEAAHGRTPEVASGIKRARPDKLVFSYQGDGDLAGIGTNEIVHVANRGEPISVIFMNNAIYGMTGGQMAPTTLIGMKTTTSPYGRQPESAGYPLRVCELLRELKGVAYLERTAVNNPQNVMKTKRALKKAFQAQLDGLGFSLVEVVSQCPTGWGMLPKDSLEWLEKEMGAYFPLGVFKDARAEEPQEVA